MTGNISQSKLGSMRKVQKTSLRLTEKDITTLINRMKSVFPTRKELQIDIDTIKEELKNEIKFLPTKEEFFSRMDTLSGEVKAMREEQSIHSEQHQISTAI